MTFRRIHADGWKIYSEKGTAWVVKTAEGKVIAFSPDLHAFGLRIPLGRKQVRIRLPVPWIGICH